MRSGGVLLALLLLALPAGAHAAGFGPARTISETVGSPPAIAVGVHGDVAVAWHDARLKAIVVRRGRSSGALGRAEVVARGRVTAPRVAVTPSGTAAVAWNRDRTGASGPARNTLRVRTARRGSPFGPAASLPFDPGPLDNVPPGGGVYTNLPAAVAVSSLVASGDRFVIAGVVGGDLRAAITRRGRWVTHHLATTANSELFHATNAAGDVLLGYAGLTGPSTIRLAHGTARFDAPARIVPTTTVQSHAPLVTLGGGRASALSSADAQGSTTDFVVWGTPTGPWSETGAFHVPVTPGGSNFAVSGLAFAVSPAGAVLEWTTSDYGNETCGGCRYAETPRLDALVQRPDGTVIGPVELAAASPVNAELIDHLAADSTADTAMLAWVDRSRLRTTVVQGDGRLAAPQTLGSARVDSLSLATNGQYALLAWLSRNRVRIAAYRDSRNTAHPAVQ